MSELVIRALHAGEAELVLSMPDPGLVGVAMTGRSYRETAAAGRYRPEWTWVALRGDRVVARAAWWGGPDDEAPLTLDWFDVADLDAGAALLRAAPHCCGRRRSAASTACCSRPAGAGSRRCGWQPSLAWLPPGRPACAR